MALTQWQLKPVATDTIASGDFVAFTDEGESGDPINKLTVDNLMETGLPLVTEDAIANGDYILFLDGGATGNTNKEAVHDLATLFAGAGMTATSSVLNVIGGDGITANANDVAITAAQTTVTSMYNASLKVGRDADNLVDFATTDNKIILRVEGVDEVELVQNALSPVTSDGVALGTGSLMWSDLFLASASVINFNNGDVTLTHSGNTLTVAGGTLATAALTATTFAPTDDITMAADKSLNLPQGANVKFTDAITQDSIDDHDAQGIIMTFTAGSDVTAFSPVYLHTDDEVHEARANAIATMPCIGVSVNTTTITNGNPVEVMMLGLIRDESFTDFGTNGAPVYVSATVGTMTNTAPSTEDHVVQVIGHSVGEKLLFVQPCLTTIEHTG